MGLLVAFLLALAGWASVSAEAGAAQAASAVSVAGKWNMALELPNMGTARPTLDLKQDGAKITGTYTGSYGTFQLEGLLKERIIEFGFSLNADGTMVQMSFRGEIAADGNSMVKGTGAIEGMGEIVWSAARAK